MAKTTSEPVRVASHSLGDEIERGKPSLRSPASTKFFLLVASSLLKAIPGPHFRNRHSSHCGKMPLSCSIRPLGCLSSWIKLALPALLLLCIVFKRLLRASSLQEIRQTGNALRQICRYRTPYMQASAFRPRHIASDLKSSLHSSVVQSLSYFGQVLKF